MRYPPDFVLSVGRLVWVYSKHRIEPRMAKIASFIGKERVTVQWLDGTTDQLTDDEWLCPRSSIKRGCR
jgi:hypothetical protein